MRQSPETRASAAADAAVKEVLAPLQGADFLSAQSPGSLRSPGAIVRCPYRGRTAGIRCALEGRKIHLAPKGHETIAGGEQSEPPGRNRKKQRALKGRRIRTQAFASSSLLSKARASLMALALAVLVTAIAGAGERTQIAALSQTRVLFDGKSLKGWKSTNFGGEGPVYVRKSEIFLGRGDPLTGITWTGGDIPKMNYEISLETMKVNGSDFFCGLTFPVGDSFCSLILGGWGGTVVGLSSFDGMDASENETSTSIDFAEGRWYRVRLRVVPGRITAWLDDKVIVDANTKGRRISTRPEVNLSKPLGIASYRTEAALRSIGIRTLR